MVVAGESKFTDLKICSRVGVEVDGVSLSSAISSSRGGAGGSSAACTLAGNILLATMFPILLPAAPSRDELITELNELKETPSTSTPTREQIFKSVNLLSPAKVYEAHRMNDGYN